MNVFTISLFFHPVWKEAQVQIPNEGGTGYGRGYTTRVRCRYMTGSQKDAAGYETELSDQQQTMYQRKIRYT
jgi:hypothetical protein